MRFRISLLIIFIILPMAAVLADETAQGNKTISYENYIAEIERSLPELKLNEMNIASAENKVKSAKASGDIYLNAGGNAYSNKQYSGVSDSGNVKGYEYYAGLNKTITSTGTTVSGIYNYSRNSYDSFNTISDYTSFEPSVSVKISQPLLYNFFGKVDRYSENNASMKLEIAKKQLRENNRSVLNAYRKLYFQWILYRESIRNFDEAIKNSNLLKVQIKRKVEAGLADNDDYQSSVSSVLSYENQRREYMTAMKNIENQLSIYFDLNSGVPDSKTFEAYYGKSASSAMKETDFKNTTSAKIMDLTMKNYAYSKGVYENKLLPELNVFAGMTKKEMSESQTYGVKDTDYNLGFEFKYYIGNNSAESSLRDVEIQIRTLEYEYRSAENSYRKQLLGYIESSDGIEEQIANSGKSLKALESKLVTERKKYSQARLNLSYIISTENSITSEKNSILALKYQMIGNYLDYTDLVR